jgi:hypothetical protein
VSEKSIMRQQLGRVRRQKRAVGIPLISLGPALVANSLRPGQEGHAMRETEVQIGNSGLGDLRLFESARRACERALHEVFAHLGKR